MSLKIILVSVGTRGDMEPFLAIGQLLKEKGHQVIAAFPEQFRKIAEDTGLGFFSLGSKFIELLESDLGREAMGGSTGLKKFIAVVKLARIQIDSQKEIVFKQREVIDQENPDLIIFNFKATYPILWKVIFRKKIIYLSPLPYLHYVKNHAHILFDGNYGAFLNKLTYQFANWGMLRTIRQAEKWLKIKSKITNREIKEILEHNKSIYTISPSLYPPELHESKNIHVLGFHERNKSSDWQPDNSLSQFLNKHKKILFITFGSMINSSPVKKTQIFLEILNKHKIPAIINTASGGLVEPLDYNKELFYFVSRIPYDFIFPQMYAVIHHGGSGTTHTALKHGCASMIIPHIVDQFAWNKIVSKLGAGPKGIKINKLRCSHIEPKILALMQDKTYKQKAEEISQQMAKEDFRQRLYDIIVE